MRLIHRLMKLEEKQQQSDAKCFPLSYFYGRDAQLEPLISGLSITSFYTSITTRLVNEVSNVKY